MEVLWKCLEHTSGPVLEFGSGVYSTALLSLFARDRYMRTVESQKVCFENVSRLHDVLKTNHKRWNGKHDIVFVSSYDDAVVDDQFWDIVFIDHAPEHRRGVDAQRLKGNCNMMIAHDSNLFKTVKPAMEHFEYAVIDNRMHLATTVASNKPLDWLMEQLPGLRPTLGKQASDVSLAE